MHRPGSSDVSPDPAVLGWLDSVYPVPFDDIRGVVDSARSRVLRLESRSAVLFFKEDRILPPSEAVILAGLRDGGARGIASIVAVDEERGWSLTRDAGITGLGGVPTQGWEELTRTLGAIQCEAGHDAHAWLARGCRDRRGSRLHDAIRKAVHAGAPDLDDEELALLRGDDARVAELCARLEDDPFPNMLVHQDFSDVNVICRPGRSTILDWSDTVVGHPFFACERLLDWCWSDAERKEAAIRAYLEPFHAYASPEVCRSSFDCVLKLRVYYEASRWRDEVEAVDDAAWAAKMHASLLASLRTMSGSLRA